MAYVCINCKKCGKQNWAYVYKASDKYTEDCPACGAEDVTTRPFRELKDPDTIMECLSAAMEDSNRHSLVGIPEELWGALKHLIPSKKHADAAHAIFDKLTEKED